MKKYLQLNDIDAYRISFHLSNRVWLIVCSWDYFAKDTVGKQFVRSVDSISANIAEGFGRFSKKDKVNFYRYAFGSIKESCDWCLKAKHRDLMKENEYTQIMEELSALPRELHGLIQFTNSKLTL